MKKRHFSRRSFLKHSTCAAMSTTTIFSTLVHLCKANTLSMPGTLTSGKKALVCLLLNGGNDSFNMLIPRGNAEYQEYLATRTDLAIPQADILPLNPITPLGKEFGLNPSMGPVQQLFENEKLAFIANIGTLVEPIANSDEYGNKQRPQRLYSHSDQKEQWQTSLPQDSSSLGWGGRTAELLSSMNENPTISMNISLEGKNIFQSSNSILEYSISNSGNGALLVDPLSTGYNNSGYLNLLRDSAADDMFTQSYQNIFKETIANLTANSIESSKFFEQAIGAVPPFVTQFSDTGISRDFQMVAKTLAARNTLGMSRQIFFVSHSGYDNHNNFARHSELLGEVSNALSEFYAVLEELGMENDVVTFSISDFGRTLTSNGNGSDHAWGGHQMVMGGNVKGKEIYGNYPDLYVDGNPLSVSSRGKLIPTTSADEYFAELISWFGVSDGDIPFVLPNIGNFYSVGSTTPPIGFLL